MEGNWLPPQAPGSNPPPPIPAGAAPPQPAFEPARGEPADRSANAPAAEAPNNEAVAGMTCAITGAGFLYFTSGLSSVVSLILGIVGVAYARRAKRNVEERKTERHRDLATAAGIASWITVGVSLLATVVWVLLIVLADGGDWELEMSSLLR